MIMLPSNGVQNWLDCNIVAVSESYDMRVWLSLYICAVRLPTMKFIQ